MSSDLSVTDSLRAKLKDRIAKCRACAADAELQAATANSEMRGVYTELARLWRALADEMEQNVQSSA